MSKKKSVRGRKSQAQSPRSSKANKKEIWKLDGVAIIEQFCLNGMPKYAVAEIPNDEDGFDIYPVVYVENDEWFINLTNGTTVRHGRIQNFFAAEVTFADEVFVFDAGTVKAKLPKAQIIANFGKGCLYL